MLTYRTMKKIQLNLARIDERLQELRWSRSDLAREIEVSPESLLKTLQRNRVSLRTVGRLACGLSLNFQEIVEAVEDEDR